MATLLKYKKGLKRPTLAWNEFAHANGLTLKYKPSFLFANVNFVIFKFDEMLNFDVCFSVHNYWSNQHFFL